MHRTTVDEWRHDHRFGQQHVRPGERRTRVVIAITAAMMVVEVAAGLAYGSMALLADGLHMASHAAALGISAFAYVYARRHAADERFAFGTGKVNALGGFTGAVLLALFALLMAWESVGRWIDPVAIAFDQAIAVAVVGLVVNGASVVILGGGHDHGHDHGHEHAHEHPHGPARAHAHGHDHNLRSAYLHVLADALTSLLAILALTAGKYLGAGWMDPLMGVVGALLVARWSWGLLRESAAVLLDRQAPAEVRAAMVAAIEERGDERVTDLHVWSIAPGLHAAELAVVADDPRPPAEYKRLLAGHARLAHVTVEVHRCPGPG